MEIKNVMLDEMNRIKPLWQELIDYLQSQSNQFHDEFASKTFEERMKPYYDKVRTGWYFIDIIWDPLTGKDIGYCISSITKELVGEMDSLFIKPEYRQLHLGHELMERALRFFEQHQTIKDIVQVSEGNEEVQSFYQKYGFQTRYYQMVRRKI